MPTFSAGLAGQHSGITSSALAVPERRTPQAGGWFT